MSRFSKAAAEALGWKIVQDSEESIVPLGDGITRTKPPLLVAEKYQGDSLIHESAESVGKLLERINLFEEHLKSRGEATIPAAPAAKPKKPKAKAKSKSAKGA